MKRIIACILASMLLFSCTFAEELELPGLFSDSCDHHFHLVSSKDEATARHAWCIICNKQVEVKMPKEDEIVTTDADPSNCSHEYYLGSMPVRVRWEADTKGMALDFHVACTTYISICSKCGDSFECCVEDRSTVFKHELTKFEDVHIENEDEHLIISHCDVCGQLWYSIGNCPIQKDGVCLTVMNGIVKQLQ